MKVAYISGPYRADTINGIVQNIRRAEKVAVKLWQMGYAVICPHKNTSLLDGLCDDDVWMKGDLELLRRSDCIVLISGWRKSEGSNEEVREAVKRNIPVFFWRDDKHKIKQFLGGE